MKILTVHGIQQCACFVSTPRTEVQCCSSSSSVYCVKKTNGFLSPTEFLRCFLSRQGFQGKGVKGPPPLYSEMYTT